MRLVHVHWAPTQGLNHPLPDNWMSLFEQWLRQEFNCVILRDSGRNWQALGFVDEKKAIEFVLRYC